jgi:hypothetical protein
MPGLLGEPSADSLDASHTAPRDQGRPAHSLVPQAGGLVPLRAVEDLVVRLEEERRQLGSEVAALRLIVEELREALVRLDERAEPEPFAAAGSQDTDHRPVLESGPQLLQLPPVEPLPEEHTLPAGSVGIEVRLLSVEDAESLAGLQVALSQLPALDGVRITQYSDGEATLRCYLRLPQSERVLLELIQSAIPSAKPLAGPGPGRLLLRMRPL